MTFIIPKGGKTVHVGRRLVSLNEGSFDTADKELVKVLEATQGVTKKESKSKQTKAPE